jgi:hypothetical protein
MVRGTTLSGVEIILLDEDASELAHVLKMHAISCRSGAQGGGTSIKKQIKFCEDLSQEISTRVETNRS